MQHSTRVAIFALTTSIALPLGARARAPVYIPGKLSANQQFAHDIYKELIEINTGMRTGSEAGVHLHRARLYSGLQ